MVKFLGADVAVTQNMPKASGKKKWWSPRKQADAAGAASSPDAGMEKEATR